jgi:hypothetical protein
MTADIIDPSYNWKQAATQEGVDYGAVQKSFMDQSYGVVANKAKILFQDPFRLGFEIVNRNEKATKMVGIFAFRVNKKLLYAPTFFVNGEIKAADMLYRADVKRFVPLTEDWCAYLVRGVEEQSGMLVDKNRRRQSDAYMDRLAYPQRVKYASEENFAEREAQISTHAGEVFVNFRHAGSVEELKGAEPGELRKMASADFDGLAEARDAFVKAAADGSLWNELLLHSADNSEMRKLLPEVINEFGPEALEKVAAFIGDSDVAARYLASHYTREELETVDGWMAKEASGPQPAIAIILDPSLSKSAAERARVFDKGYALVDKRPPGSTNTVVEELESDVIKELASPGKVSVLLNGGEMENAYLFRRDRDMLDCDSYPPAPEGCRPSSRPECVYFPASKGLLCLRHGQDVYGDELVDWDKGTDNLVEAKSLKVGKCYVAVSDETRTISDVFLLEDRAKDGASTCLSIVNSWGDPRKVHYAPGRSASQGNYISDETKFLEVKCDVERDDNDRVRRIESTCDKAVMSGSGLDEWMRTAGGLTSSNDLRVKANPNLTFDVEHRSNGTLLKAARDLGMLEAHLKIAEDFCLTVDKAGEILDKAVDQDVTYRIFDTLEKGAYLTRVEGMEDWIQSFDPELNVRLDAPQYQILTTFTPRRPDQQQRYGDVYQRVPTSLDKAASSLMPMDAVMSQSPEQLAQMSEMYDMPHIFDHACVGRMATTSHNIVEQIKKYIPDLETGVDRYFRILFLLRYRPSDFEEIYGKDDLIEFEDSLTELASRAGEQLLTILQQFEPDQYASQEN